MINNNFFLKIYLFIYDRHGGGAETQEEGEAGSMPGARLGTRSQDSRIAPGPKAGAKPLRHPGIPQLASLSNSLGWGFKPKLEIHGITHPEETHTSSPLKHSKYRLS